MARLKEREIKAIGEFKVWFEQEYGHRLAVQKGKRLGIYYIFMEDQDD